MSISGVLSSYSAYQPSSTQSNLKQVRQDFQDLAGALQSGDMPGAQTAYAALQQLIQGMQSASQPQGNGNGTQHQFNTDLAAVGKALQSGDVSAAQDAFKKLQQDMQAAGMGHHHHHHAHSAQGASNAVSPPTGSSAAGTTDSDGDNDGSRAKAINVTA